MRGWATKSACDELIVVIFGNFRIAQHSSVKNDYMTRMNLLIIGPMLIVSEVHFSTQILLPRHRSENNNDRFHC